MILRAGSGIEAMELSSSRLCLLGLIALSLQPCLGLRLPQTVQPRVADGLSTSACRRSDGNRLEGVYVSAQSDTAVRALE